MIDIKSLFEKFSNANFFSRVDNIHILELHIGLDEKGRKAIEFRGKFTPRKVSGTSAICMKVLYSFCPPFCPVWIRTVTV